jgi:hypothetical protein
LRVLLDNQGGRLVRGESLDARELLMASEALSRLLPPMREPAPEADRVDPREVMWRNYLEARRRGALAGEGIDGAKLTIERLKTELAAKDARIAELEAALAGSVPLPPNAVKLPTRNDNPSPSAPPAPPAAPSAAAPAAPRNWDETEGGKKWHAWCDAGGSYAVPGSIGDRWSDNR